MIDQASDHRVAKRNIETRRTAEDGSQDRKMPDGDQSSRAEDGQRRCLRKHHRLSQQQRATSVDAIGENAGHGREKQDCDVLAKGDETQQQRRA